MHNLLLVISKFPPEYSGPGVRIPRLYQWLKTCKSPYKFQVLCNGLEQTKDQHYTYQDMQIHRIGSDWTRRFLKTLLLVPTALIHSIAYQVEFLKTLLTLFFKSSYKNIDLVHIAGHSGGTAAALCWAKIKNMPVLMELVTANAPYRQKFFYLFKTPEIEQLKVVALTEDMRQKCLKAGLEDNKIWCRPNPIDENKFKIASKAEKKSLRSELTPFGIEDIVLVSVAKMMPQKNQFLILKALTHLPQNFVALIAGPLIKDGPLYARDRAYVNEMEDFIASNGLNHRVHRVYDLVDADKYVKAGDIYMMPAWNEGFGTPMLEAMATGLPVIGNKNEPAFREWIINNENGYLCDIDKPQDWADAIQNVVTLSENDRKKMAADIHVRAGQSSIYSTYENIIFNLLGDPK